MDIFTEKLEELLGKKTEIVREHQKANEEEKQEARRAKEALGEQGLTYDMNQFLKTIRQFEAERAKKSKKKKDIKDLEDI